MKIPPNTESALVASYLGIKTLGKFKNILKQLAAGARLTYYHNGMFHNTRVAKLKHELKLR